MKTAGIVTWSENSEITSNINSLSQKLSKKYKQKVQQQSVKLPTQHKESQPRTALKYQLISIVRNVTTRLRRPTGEKAKQIIGGRTYAALIHKTWCLAQFPCYHNTQCTSQQLWN